MFLIQLLVGDILLGYRLHQIAYGWVGLEQYKELIPDVNIQLLQVYKEVIGLRVLVVLILCKVCTRFFFVRKLQGLRQTIREYKIYHKPSRLKQPGASVHTWILSSILLCWGLAMPPYSGFRSPLNVVRIFGSLGISLRVSCRPQSWVRF